MFEKSCILLTGKGVPVACGFSSIKIYCSVNRFHEVYVFSIKYCYSDILLKKYELYLFLLLLYWHGFFDVSVTLLDVSVTILK